MVGLSILDYYWIKAFSSLCGRRSKGKSKEIRARDRARGRREEGGGRREEGNAWKEATVFTIPPTNLKNHKNKTTVNDWLSNKSGRDSCILVVFLALLFLFCFPKTRNLK